VLFVTLWWYVVRLAANKQNEIYHKDTRHKDTQRHLKSFDLPKEIARNHSLITKEVIHLSPVEKRTYLAIDKKVDEKGSGCSFLMSQ
jgi:hypothetical protein